jgi:hypothetical protein
VLIGVIKRRETHPSFSVCHSLFGRLLIQTHNPDKQHLCLFIITNVVERSIKHPSDQFFYPDQKKALACLLLLLSAPPY